MGGVGVGERFRGVEVGASGVKVGASGVKECRVWERRARVT